MISHRSFSCPVYFLLVLVFINHLGFRLGWRVLVLVARALVQSRGHPRGALFAVPRVLALVARARCRDA